MLPLFPLSTVLFPGMRLPLHIFEERYQTLEDVQRQAHAGKQHRRQREQRQHLAHIDGRTFGECACGACSASECVCLRRAVARR